MKRYEINSTADDKFIYSCIICNTKAHHVVISPFSFNLHKPESESMSDVPFPLHREDGTVRKIYCATCKGLTEKLERARQKDDFPTAQTAHQQMREHLSAVRYPAEHGFHWRK